MDCGGLGPPWNDTEDEYQGSAKPPQSRYLRHNFCIPDRMPAPQKFTSHDHFSVYAGGGGRWYDGAAMENLVLPARGGTLESRGVPDACRAGTRCARRPNLRCAPKLSIRKIIMPRLLYAPSSLFLTPGAMLPM